MFINENLSIIAILTIVICSLCCALIGNFVLWKKMSFFGDAISHSAIFGVAVGLFLEIDQIIALTIFNFIFSYLVTKISKQKIFSIDSIVMIFSYFFIALGIVFNQSFNNGIEIEEFMFGDISVINLKNLIVIILILLSVIIFIIFYTKKFLLLIINNDIAISRKIDENHLNFLFMVLLSILIAFAVKVTGILLVTALMVIPCAIARIIAKNPQHMIFISAGFGIIIPIIGAIISSLLNINIVPSLIIIYCLIFFALLSLNNLFYEKI